MMPGLERRTRLAMALAALGLAAMAYVGAYQVRVVDQLVCPAFGNGCADAADAAAAHPFGVPDGLLGVGLQAALLALIALRGRSFAWNRAAFAFAVVVVAANAIGAYDMWRAKTWCTWCLLTALLCLPTAWLVRPTRPAPGAGRAPA